MRWRRGGSVGRTIYAYLGEDHSGHARDDESWMIGTMDSAYLAALVCEAHNAQFDGSGEA